MKSKTLLFALLETLSGTDPTFAHFVGIGKEGLKHKQVSDETYGPHSMIYLFWPHLNARNAGEKTLADHGFRVSPDYCRKSGNCREDSPRSEIQVSYFRGYHWDE